LRLAIDVCCYDDYDDQRQRACIAHLLISLLALRKCAYGCALGRASYIYIENCAALSLRRL
jgi:hypothetical protein